VLVETALAAVGLGAALDSALVVSFNLVRISAHALALLSVSLALTVELVVFVFAQPSRKLSFFLKQLLDLVSECDISKKEAAVFVVVSFFLRGGAAWVVHYIWNSLSS
jgi:hypothetical protein